MATYTWMSAPTRFNPGFRGFVRGIADALAACGWVRTADTGQIDLASDFPAPANGQSAGFLIWRLNDALQAVAPIFLRLEFAARSTTADAMEVLVTVGPATNGAGAILTPFVENRSTNTTNTGGSTVEHMGYASGDGHSLCLLPCPTYTGSHSFALYIERSRNAQGQPTADGFLIALGCANAGGRVFVVTSASGAHSADFRRAPGLVPGTVNGLIISNQNVATVPLSRDGNIAPVMPVPCLAPGVLPWVSNIITIVSPGDAAGISIIQAATINGETRTYRAFTNSNASAGLIDVHTGGGAVAVMPAMLWED